jgi:hypothetical protein
VECQRRICVCVLGRLCLGDKSQAPKDFLLLGVVLPAFTLSRHSPVHGLQSRYLAAHLRLVRHLSHLSLLIAGLYLPTLVRVLTAKMLAFIGGGLLRLGAAHQGDCAGHEGCWHAPCGHAQPQLEHSWQLSNHAFGGGWGGAGSGKVAVCQGCMPALTVRGAMRS